MFLVLVSSVLIQVTYYNCDVSLSNKQKKT